MECDRSRYTMVTSCKVKKYAMLYVYMNTLSHCHELTLVIYYWNNNNMVLIIFSTSHTFHYIWTSADAMVCTGTNQKCLKNSYWNFTFTVHNGNSPRFILDGVPMAQYFCFFISPLSYHSILHIHFLPTPRCLTSLVNQHTVISYF